MHAIAFEQPQPVTTLRADLPYSLQRVVEKCLRKKAEDRYQDMREVVSDLKAVKREMDTGVSSRAPLMVQMRGWVEGLTVRGALWGGIVGAILGAFAVLLLVGGQGNRAFPIIVIIIIGSVMYRRFRNRGQKEARKFVKRASSLKEVRLITFQKGEFTVIADNPVAKTYLRLNDYLETANKNLFRGEPMTMVVRENVEEGEIKRVLSSPGVQYLRDDTKRSSGLRRLRKEV
jgi:hypothetical protein